MPQRPTRILSQHSALGLCGVSPRHLASLIYPIGWIDNKIPVFVWGITSFCPSHPEMQSS